MKPPRPGERKSPGRITLPAAGGALGRGVIGVDWQPTPLVSEPSNPRPAGKPPEETDRTRVARVLLGGLLSGVLVFGLGLVMRPAGAYTLLDSFDPSGDLVPSPSLSLVPTSTPTPLFSFAPSASPSPSMEPSPSVSIEPSPSISSVPSGAPTTSLSGVTPSPSPVLGSVCGLGDAPAPSPRPVPENGSGFVWLLVQCDLNGDKNTNSTLVANEGPLGRVAVKMACVDQPEQSLLTNDNGTVIFTPGPGADCAFTFSKADWTTVSTYPSVPLPLRLPSVFDGVTAIRVYLAPTS